MLEKNVKPVSGINLSLPQDDILLCAYGNKPFDDKEIEEYSTWIASVKEDGFHQIYATFPDCQKSILQAFNIMTFLSHGNKRDKAGLNVWDMLAIKQLMRNDNWHMSWEFSERSLFIMSKMFLKYRKQLREMGCSYPATIVNGCDYS